MISLLVLAFLLGLVMFSPRMRSRFFARKNRFFTWKNNTLIAGLYLACLLAVLPVYYLLILPRPAGLPGENSVSVFSPDPGEVEQYAAQGNLAQLKGVYENSRRSFKLEGNKLDFAISSQDYSYVYVAGKSAEDGKIEVATYTTSSVANGIDFSQQIAPPDISLQNNTLLIKNGATQHLTFASFQPDFPLAQFRRDNQGSPGNINLFNAYESPVRFGWRFVYVRVPENVAVEKGNANINMIGNWGGKD